MTVSQFLNNSGLKPTDAKILLQDAAGLTAAEIIAHPEKVLEDKTEKKLLEYAKQRLEGKPVEYIIGKKNFYKDTFSVCEGVLIPQPDTEILVEEAVKFAEKNASESISILDLCAGTGCIGISVANDLAKSFKEVNVVFADISDIAIDCCRKNTSKLKPSVRYEIIKGNLFENLGTRRFDMILTNPPYIATSVIGTLESDVQHEPVLALDGGSDGLELIRKTVIQAPGYAKPDGIIMMEIGYDQGPEVSRLFADNNYKEIEIFKDLGQRDRVVKARF